MDNFDEKVRSAFIIAGTMFLLVALVSMMFPLGEMVGVINGNDYYENCGCDNVTIDAESTNANEIRSNLFDIEQVEEPVVRMLVSVPNDTEHKYLVVKVEWVTEDNRTIKQQREFINVDDDKVQIVDIERAEKMEYAPKMRVKPMGWTNNRLSGEVWTPYDETTTDS